MPMSLRFFSKLENGLMGWRMTTEGPVANEDDQGIFLHASQLLKRSLSDLLSVIAAQDLI